MSMTSAQVSVGTTATVLVTGIKGSAELTIKNAGAASVFLGGSGVTTTTGLDLASGATVGLTVHESLYGIVATGTVTVHVLHQAT